MRNETNKLDKLADKMWTCALGHESTQVFAAGVTVMVNAAALMNQATRSEAALRLRDIANKIQNGEAFEN